MLIRRAGVRVVAAAIVACAVPVAGYMLWFNAWYNQFAMTQSTGVFLYARVMVFADCRKFALPVDEKALCTSAPPSHRLLTQDYIWDQDAPLRRFPPPEFSPLTNLLAKGFATRAIETQPLDYARVVWDDSWRSFDWKRKVFPDPVTYGEYVFASASGGPAQEPATGHGFGTRFSVPRYADGSGITHVVSPYAGIMRVYQKYVFLPGTILGVLLAIGLGGMVVAWRRLGGEILLPWAVAVAMIVLPAATAEFDYRYLLPVVPFACLATAMMFGAGNPVGDRLAVRRARRPHRRASRRGAERPARAHRAPGPSRGRGAGWHDSGADPPSPTVRSAPPGGAAGHRTLGHRTVGACTSCRRARPDATCAGRPATRRHEPDAVQPDSPRPERYRPEAAAGPRSPGCGLGTPLRPSLPALSRPPAGHSGRPQTADSPPARHATKTRTWAKDAALACRRSRTQHHASGPIRVASLAITAS